MGIIRFMLNCAQQSIRIIEILFKIGRISLKLILTSLVFFATCFVDLYIMESWKSILMRVRISHILNSINAKEVLGKGKWSCLIFFLSSHNNLNH